MQINVKLELSVCLYVMISGTKLYVKLPCKQSK